MKLAILGAGNMGGAIAKGIAAEGKVKAENITVTARTTATLEKITASNPAFHTTTNNRQAVQGADLIIVAVKPWLLEEVLAGIRDVLDYRTQQVASVVAGTSFVELERMLDNGSGVCPVLYRIIPNTAISLGESVTFIAQERASEEQLNIIVSLFSGLGATLVVPEQMMGAGTALASCGIAYALKYLDAAIAGGVESGFTTEEAREVVMQTMRGALKMLAQNQTMPQTEIDKVTTPGGITLKGLDAMEKAGFSEAVKAGLRASK